MTRSLTRSARRAGGNRWWEAAYKPRRVSRGTRRALKRLVRREVEDDRTDQLVSLLETLPPSFVLSVKAVPPSD